MISYLGIDPGLAGGLVVISDKAIDLKFAMPTITITKNSSSKKEIDMEGISSFLFNLPRPLTCCIEEQHAFRQNLSTSCTLCKNYGILLGLLSAAGIKPIEISSSVWQKNFGIVSVKKHPQGKTTKQQAFEIGSELYPNEIFGVSAKTPKYHDGIGDATLIARYCQSLFSKGGGK
jgi:Holliday junction resolvasome RuvABC endonuclease subunit